MNPHAQQLAIAKACHDYFERHPVDPYLIGDGDGGWKEIPDYLGDLNAMLEAALTLNNKQRATYCSILVDVADADVDFKTVEATAGQRAEAFLKTLNLWDDSK